MNIAATPPVLRAGAATVTPLPHIAAPNTGRTVGIAAARSGQGGATHASTSDFIRRLAARIGRTHLNKDVVGLMHNTLNPLWNISSRQAQMIYDFARSGNFAQLEYLYNEVENCSPVFSVCVTRRCGALSELDWKVVRSDERLNRNADASLVKEQIECLETAVAKIDNLPEALEHFALSAFRGFSVASVWRGDDGVPQHIECLDHWNICLDKANQKWLWNPGAVSFFNPTFSSNGLKEIPPEASIVVQRKREIDWPAMKIFLRESIGERDWGRCLETYGLPPVIITMPQFTNQEDQDAYVEAAEGVFEGRSGVIPHGSEVNFASEARGVNPFSEFIDHQMKLYVLLSTGGTLTSLSEATGIGSGASETQMDTWKQIVRADVRIVSNAINRQLCRSILEREFKGKPMLAEFKLDTEPRMSAKDVVEMASSLSSAGFEMDASEISQVVGFTVRKKQEGGMGFNAETPSPPPSAPDGGSSLSGPGIVTQAGPTGEVVHKAEPETLNAAIEPPTTPSASSKTEGHKDIPPTQETPQNAAMPPLREKLETEGIGEPPKETKPAPSLAAAEKADAVTPQAEKVGERLVRSLQSDFKDVADELAKVLALPEDKQAGAAAELLAKIDSLVPEDPAMAEIIEEQMREAFQQQISKQPEGDAPAANKAIPNSKK